MLKGIRHYRREAKAQMLLALPILGGQLAQTANGFVDTVMAGRVSAADLAAVAIGASVWVPVFLLMTGILMSATPILARHLGAACYHRVNPIAQQAVWLALLLGVLAALLLRSMAPLLDWMAVDPLLRPRVSGYLDALSWGMPGAALFLALRSYTEAMQHTRPVLLISVAGLLINIPSNYVLIYGKLGLPALGGVGCGWATSLVFWAMALMMAGYVHRHPAYNAARLSAQRRHFELHTLLQILRLGLPVGLSIFFEVSIFAVIALLIANLGPVTVAGHQVALNFTGLLFMLPLSLALAVTVRVSHARGLQQPEQVRRAVHSGLMLTLLIGIAAAAALLVARSWIPLLYTDNRQVQQLASELLLFAALYQISDAWQVTVSGALRGFEDTRVPMLITLLAYWGIGLPVGYSLALSDHWRPAMGPAGFWVGLLVGLTAAALMLSVRLGVRLRHQSHHSSTVPVASQPGAR